MAGGRGRCSASGCRYNAGRRRNRVMSLSVKRMPRDNAADRPGRAAPTSVLVVDDEPLIRDTLAEYLTQEGFHVTACADAEEALSQAEGRRFDVALCDVQLPGLD